MFALIKDGIRFAAWAARGSARHSRRFHRGAAAFHGVGLALALLLPGRAAAASGEGDPARLVPEQSTIATGTDFGWTVNLSIENPGDTGLYLDSLLCDVEDLDPGETRAERTTHLTLTPLVRLVGSVTEGGSTVVQHNGPAIAEHARLTYRLHVHRIDAAPFVLEAVVEAKPGGSARLESTFLDVDHHRVECVFLPASHDTGSAPGILIVHGHGNHARHMLPNARLLTARGYAVMLVSMPGYGQSDGPADFMGPATVRAVAAAFDRLKRSPGVDSTRLGAWGLSRGATAVAELAAKRTDLRAIVLQSGIYDLWATYRGTSLPGFPETIVAEAGSDSAAWRARSPIFNAGGITAPTLVLHGEHDGNVPAAQAHAFVEALKARGVETESRFYPTAEHNLPVGDVLRTSIDFLMRRLAHP